MPAKEHLRHAATAAWIVAAVAVRTPAAPIAAAIAATATVAHLIERARAEDHALITYGAATQAARHAAAASAARCCTPLASTG